MSYAPHIAFWAERGRALTAELVGGNQERLSGRECAKLASRALGLLPDGHGPVTVRVDSAYYAIELLHRLRRERTRFTVPRAYAPMRDRPILSGWRDFAVTQLVSSALLVCG